MNRRLDVDQRLAHLYPSPDQVDATPTQAEHFTEAEPAEAGDQHEGSIAGIDRVGHLFFIAALVTALLFNRAETMK